MNLQLTQSKLDYGMKIWEVEHVLSTSLVVCFPPTSGGLGPTATVVLKHIASMISDSQDVPPPVGLFWLLLQHWFYIDMFCYHVYLWVMIVLPSPT